MKLRRMLLVAAAMCAVAFGTMSLSLPIGDSGQSCFSAGACGRCGDGQCVKSCGETAQSCPRDCGVPSTDAR